MDQALGTAHQHDHDGLQADAAQDHAIGDQEDGDNLPGSDHGCTHVHAHCCAATAILVALDTAPSRTGVGQLRIERNGTVPYGQLSNPPLRPPRLAA